MKQYGQLIYEYFKTNFIDDKNGGIYSAVVGNEVVTEDKLLLNTSLALLTAVTYEDLETAVKQYEDLNLFLSEKNRCEVLESSSVSVDIGKVISLQTELITTLSLLSYGTFISDTQILLTAKEYFQKVSNKALENNFASIISVDGDILLSDQRALNIILGVYISNEMQLSFLNRKYLDRFQQFKSVDGGLWSFLDSSNRPLRNKGKLLIDNACTLLLNSAIVDTNETMNFIDKNYKHPEGGYWNKIDKNNKVSVDNTTSYYTFNSSPFPYKSMLDHAILVYALSKKNRNSIVYKRSLSELLRYYDLKNSGVFLGGGNWFSTPVTPTVPLARLVMVPPHTVGAFSVGNTSYLPLHEKNATVQLVSSLALKGINKIEIDYPTKIKEVSFSPLDTSLKYISSGQLTNSHIDIEKYKLWLEKTKSGFGYGLTPYQSPLGFKSDRSPQNFSAMHVISDKSVLYEEIPDKDNIFLTMKAAQNKDGGFGEQAGVVSELFTTYCVVATSFILKNKKKKKKKCLDFVKSCQNDDGGFGNAPGYPSDIWHTNFGVLILHLLNSEANFPEKLIQYLVSAQNEDGGFAVFPNLSSEVFSTFRAIDSLRLLDIEIPNKERVISWLQSMQDVNEGGFHISENKPISFVGSYHAIAALYLLDTLPINIEKIKIWFGNHQAKDGGFSKLLHHPSDTTDEGFISLHASYMLEQKINPYWIAIIT